MPIRKLVLRHAGDDQDQGVLAFGIACAACAEQIRTLMRSLGRLPAKDKTPADLSDMLFLWLQVCSAAGEFVRVLKDKKVAKKIDSVISSAKASVATEIDGIRFGSLTDLDKRLLQIRGEYIGHWNADNINEALSMFGDIEDWPALSETGSDPTNEHVAYPITYRSFMMHLLAQLGTTEEELMSQFDALSHRAYEISRLAIGLSMAAIDQAGYEVQIGE